MPNFKNRITDRTNAMDRYLQSIQSYPLLSIKEEVECAKALSLGKKARKDLLELKKKLSVERRKHLRGRSTQAEIRLREAEKVLPEAETRLRKAEKRLREAETKLREAEQALPETETKLPEAEQQELREAEKELREAEQGLHEAENNLREAEKGLSGTGKEFARLEKIFKSKKKKLEPIIKKGEKALDTLIKGNLRFVISVVKQFITPGIAMCDLINEGNLGLMKGINRFDHDRGFKLISYVVWWIKQAIMQAIQEKGKIVRRPLNCVALENKIAKAIRKLQHKYKREVITSAQIAEELKIDEAIVKSTIASKKRPLSVDASFKEGQDGSLSDILEHRDADRPDDILVQQSNRQELRMMISKLGEREQYIIKSYYGVGKADNFSETLEDIGEKVDLTRERVRQIKEKALKELKALFLKHREKNEALQDTFEDDIPGRGAMGSFFARPSFSGDNPKASQNEVTSPLKKKKKVPAAIATLDAAGKNRESKSLQGVSLSPNKPKRRKRSSSARRLPKSKQGAIEVVQKGGITA